MNSRKWYTVNKLSYKMGNAHPVNTRSEYIGLKALKYHPMWIIMDDYVY